MKKLAAASLALALLGCEEEPALQFGQPSPPAGGRSAKTAAPEAEKASDLPPAVDFQETAFNESERSRDPFRNYARAFVDEARGQVTSQREVLLDQYAIEELKLVALIQRIEPARAMLVDPSGVGHVVQRGQFIGRASVVQPTGGVGAAYEVNWRVDRIREGDLVLVRDDPSNPDVPSATRVLPLRTGEITATGEKKDGQSEGGLESELRKMQERLAALAAAEAAKQRQEQGEKP